jgi:hypothetical protein
MWVVFFRMVGCAPQISGFEGSEFVSQCINNEFEFGLWYGIGLNLDGWF